MADVIDQDATENNSDKVFTKITASTAQTRAPNPACAATKGSRIMTFVSSGPFIETSLVG
jgi:hypothetical protein